VIAAARAYAHGDQAARPRAQNRPGPGAAGTRRRAMWIQELQIEKCKLKIAN